MPDQWLTTCLLLVLEDNVGLDAKLSLLLSGVIQLMFVIGAEEFRPIPTAATER